MWKFILIKDKFHVCVLHASPCLTKEVKKVCLLSSWYLFFQCNFARFIWSTVQIVYTFYPPRSVANIFSKWLNGVDTRFKHLITMIAIAVIWSLRLCRNDKVFNNVSSSLMQVIYSCTATLRSWLPLQRVDHRDLFTEMSSRLEDMTRDIFSQHR
jgi:hypothetical protein